MTAGVKTRCLQFALLWILVLAAAPASAQTRPQIIALPVEGTVSDIKSSAAVRFDPEQALNPLTLMRSDEGFQPYSEDLEELSPPLWLKLRFSVPRDSSGRYMLKAARRFFVDFDVFVTDANDQLRGAQAAYGEVATAQSVGRHYAVAFEAEPGQLETLLLYVHTVEGSLLPLELSVQDQDSFEASRLNEFVLFSVLLGILLALVFYNLVLYQSFRQRAHLLYAAAVGSLALFLSAESGMLQAYVLPQVLLPHVTRLTLLFDVAAMITIGLFFLDFVNARRESSAVTWIVRAGLLMLAGFALALLITPNAQLMVVATMLRPTQLVVQVVLLVGALLAGRRGASEGYVFLAAWSLFLVSEVERFLVSVNLIARIAELEHLMDFGALAFALILAVGLARRVRQIASRRSRAIVQQHEAARPANLDPLTDAFNRRFLRTYLENVTPTEPGEDFGRDVMILDLDHFEAINEEHGHDAGDVILRELVKRLEQVLREGDVVSRLGGDEFVIVLSDQHDRSALTVANRVLRAVADRPVVHESREIPVTVSIGVVSDIPPRCPVSDILRMADQALYQAKQGGRNRAELFDVQQTRPFRHGFSPAPNRRRR